MDQIQPCPLIMYCLCLWGCEDRAEYLHWENVAYENENIYYLDFLQEKFTHPWCQSILIYHQLS